MQFWLSTDAMTIPAPVSYTHLDVYKRQEFEFTPAMLTEMAGELRHALEQVSEPSAKEEKTELKKKRKQLNERCV